MRRVTQLCVAAALALASVTPTFAGQTPCGVTEQLRASAAGEITPGAGGDIRNGTVGQSSAGVAGEIPNDFTGITTSQLLDASLDMLRDILLLP